MKFRKKPVVIDAEQYKEGMEDGFDIRYASESTPHITWGIPSDGEVIEVKVPYIQTLEGKMYINAGDWIITGIKGERYPCKPDIFEATYEPVEMSEERLNELKAFVKDNHVRSVK